MKLEIEDLKKIELLPGETLVVRCEYAKIGGAVVDNFKRNFEELFPSNKLMVILSKDMELYKIISEG